MCVFCKPADIFVLSPIMIFVSFKFVSFIFKPPLDLLLIRKLYSESNALWNAVRLCVLLVPTAHHRCDCQVESCWHCTVCFEFTTRSWRLPTDLTKTHHWTACRCSASAVYIEFAISLWWFDSKIGNWTCWLQLSCIGRCVVTHQQLWSTQLNEFSRYSVSIFATKSVVN